MIRTSLHISKKVYSGDLNSEFVLYSNHGDCFVVKGVAIQMSSGGCQKHSLLILGHTLLTIILGCRRTSNAANPPATTAGYRVDITLVIFSAVWSFSAIQFGCPVLSYSAVQIRPYGIDPLKPSLSVISATGKSKYFSAA